MTLLHSFDNLQIFVGNLEIRLSFERGSGYNLIELLIHKLLAYKSH